MADLWGLDDSKPKSSAAKKTPQSKRAPGSSAIDDAWGAGGSGGGNHSSSNKRSPIYDNDDFEFGDTKKKTSIFDKSPQKQPDAPNFGIKASLQSSAKKDEPKDDFEDLLSKYIIHSSFRLHYGKRRSRR